MGQRKWAFVFLPQKVQVLGKYYKTCCTLHRLPNLEVRIVVFFFKKYENCVLSFWVYLYKLFSFICTVCHKFSACHLKGKVLHRQEEQNMEAWLSVTQSH